MEKIKWFFILFGNLEVNLLMKEVDYLICVVDIIILFILVLVRLLDCKLIVLFIFILVNNC